MYVILYYSSFGNVFGTYAEFLITWNLHIVWYHCNDCSTKAQKNINVKFETCIPREGFNVVQKNL